MTPEDQVLAALRQVKYPGYSRDIVSFGIIKEVAVHGSHLDLTLQLTTSDEKIAGQIEAECKQALQAVPQIETARVRIGTAAPASPLTGGGLQTQNRIEGVRHVIAVASGKGGVGKSTVASNLAAAFSHLGWKVGLCDCDLYGPSIGLMFGVHERPTLQGDDTINPIEVAGLKLMSMSFLIEGDASPVVLRGPMVTRYTQQFLKNVDWRGLDLLILDLPPGTGDIQLTIVQTIALAGAVVVTTPQEVALIDARKAASMFAKVNVPVLGLVENMSTFVCPSDGKRYDIFGSGGGAREADRLGVPLLGEIPIDIPTREAGDSGLPVTARHPDNPVARAFIATAEKLRTILEQKH